MGLKGKKKAGTREHSPPRNSIGELIEFILPGCSESNAHLKWPPDVFALAATLLKTSGAYVKVVEDWRPPGLSSRRDWSRHARRVGKDWRAGAIDSAAPPKEVTAAWEMVCASAASGVLDVLSHKKLTTALLELVAYADEASAGVGVLSAEKDLYEFEAWSRLITNDSLCSDGIALHKARVIPKLHTPNAGLTLRSLTHHLALVSGNETAVTWEAAPRGPKGKLNLLVVPWPLTLDARQFQPARDRDGEPFVKHGLVTYVPNEDVAGVKRELNALLAEALSLGYRIDGIIFPELALTPKEFQAVERIAADNDSFLVAGVAYPKGPNGLAHNRVRFSSPLGPLIIRGGQAKHHRWKIDRSQVDTYGLHWQLDSGRDWWEAIPLERTLTFLPLNPELTMCCLVCEDLARQEPVAEIVRAVGPNLVIALLMDAPQLSKRWPARYATVLADDPGCSVLTVTSAGMVGLSKPPAGVTKPSRSVAMWKDHRSSDPVEMELPDGHAGLVLSLWNELAEEVTVDGRTDGGVTVFPRLAGFCALKGSATRSASLTGRSKRSRMKV